VQHLLPKPVLDVGVPRLRVVRSGPEIRRDVGAAERQRNEMIGLERAGRALEAV
jgi:hypothetical protein